MERRKLRVRIRCEFHEACRKYAEEEQESECKIDLQIQNKLRNFYTNLRTYRQRAEFLPIHELIEELLKTTGYGDYLAAEPAGAQRRQCADAHRAGHCL